MITNSEQSKDDLIYVLIFGQEEEFKIDVSKFIDDIYQYDEFMIDIKLVLKKSKVRIIRSQISLDSKTAIWHLKVKK